MRFKAIWQSRNKHSTTLTLFWHERPAKRPKHTLIRLYLLWLFTRRVQTGIEVHLLRDNFWIFFLNQNNGQSETTASLEYTSLSGTRHQNTCFNCYKWSPSGSSRLTFGSNEDARTTGRSSRLGASPHKKWSPTNVSLQRVKSRTTVRRMSC